MKEMCIYERNRGLGNCAGQIEKIRVANKRSHEWKGLESLKERLQKSGEEPGVCKAHEKRAEENGFLLEGEIRTTPGKSGGGRLRPQLGDRSRSPGSTGSARRDNGG